MLRIPFRFRVHGATKQIVALDTSIEGQSIAKEIFTVISKSTVCKRRKDEETYRGDGVKVTSFETPINLKIASTSYSGARSQRVVDYCPFRWSQQPTLTNNKGLL